MTSMSKFFEKVRYAVCCFVGGIVFALFVFRSGGKKGKAAESCGAFREAERKRKEIEETDAHDVVALSGCGSEAECTADRLKAEFRKRVRDRLGENLQRE